MVVGLGHEPHAVGDPHARGLRGDGPVEDLGVGAVRVLLEEVMFHRPEGVPAELLAGQGLLEGVLVRAVLTLLVPWAGHRDLIEQGKLHQVSLVSAGARPRTRWARTKARTASWSWRSTTTDGMTAKLSMRRTIHSAAWRRSRPARTSPRSSASASRGSQNSTHRSTSPSMRAVSSVAKSDSSSAGNRVGSRRATMNTAASATWLANVGQRSTLAVLAATNRSAARSRTAS